MLLAVATFAPVHAWEFSMSGAWTWEYETYGQLGDQGFFGKYDIDNSTLGTLQSANGWLGNQVDPRLSTSSDQAKATQYFSADMQLRFNKAVRLRGQYYVGQWLTNANGNGVGELLDSEYLNNERYGIHQSFSPGYWNTMWLSAQTPFALVVVGKRPGGLGPGLIFDGDNEVPSESTLLHVPYGPMSFGFYWYPWRRSYFGRYPVTTDKSGMRNHIGAYMTYDVGPLSMGAGTDYIFKNHLGPESAATAADKQTFNPITRTVSDGTIYAKYNNGRFFWNGEVAWYNQTDRRQGSLAGGEQRFAPTYWELWTFFTETGIYAGPAKFSFLWAWYPGPDRRNGVLIDRQPYVPASFIDSGASIYMPYSLIMVYNYGTGNNSFTFSSLDGFVTDANALAGRIDYAVAANLNLFGSFFWADRLSDGYGWGYVKPDAVDSPYTYNVVYQREGTEGAATAAPAIPDKNLGWEITTGFNWQLLENYVLSATFAYWQPGKWFNYACVDRNVADWDNPTPGNNFGVNPNRSIDPIYGVNILLNGEF